jgi:DNA mismatch repair protein MutL
MVQEGAMGSIRVLPDHLANQIAAGEVVERPTAALKELVENSLDAGASRIEVQIQAGGRRLIQVRDNGCGMDADDCLMALERHATSKLTRAEDLFSVHTLGFRGEALPSIASVSRFTLESVAQGAASGFRVEVHGGRIVRTSPIAGEAGTTVRVESLFYNMPARRKFLRSIDTEWGWMVQLMTQLSLAHLNRAFSLQHEGRSSLDLHPVSCLSERIYQHFGKAMLPHLLEFSFVRDWLKVEGAISTPDYLLSSRSQQHLFVNGRLVRDKLLTHALSEAYRGFGDGSRHPAAFLFLSVPGSEVDVNVHPAKTELRFIQSSLVHDAVRDGLRSLLLARPRTVTYRSQGSAPEQAADAPSSPGALAGQPTSPATLLAVGRPAVGRPAVGRPAEGRPAEGRPAEGRPALAQSGQPSPVGAAQHSISGSGHAACLASPGVEDGAPTRYESFLQANRALLVGFDDASVSEEAVVPGVPGWAGNPEAQQTPMLQMEDLPRVIGQFRDSFILAEQGETLLLIDQHVLHERLLYDEIRQAFDSQSIERQILLLPEPVELNPGQRAELERLLPLVQRFGFDLDPMDGNCYLVREVPAFLAGGDLGSLVGEILEKAQGLREETAVEALIDLFAASKACKAAIKINMRLTREKMEHLLARLWRSGSPLFCPHGRPVVLSFPLAEIERNFLRR